MITANQKFNTEVSPTWCPGCGNYGIWQALKTALFELNLDPHQVYISYDIGCFGNGTNFTKTYAFHSLHGRALPPAVGAKIANKDLVVLALIGDGGAYGEGVQHLIHSARYNIDITYLVANNQRFSLTTGQASPTTDKNIKTPTTPFGETKQPVNPLMMSLASGTSFLARGFAGDQKHLSNIIKQAIGHKGFSHVDILQPCVSFNKENTFEWYRSVVYKLEEHEYDPGEYNRAVEKSQEFEVDKKMPIGVIYKEKRETYTDQMPQLKKEALCKQKINNTNIF